MPVPFLCCRLTEVAICEEPDVWVSLEKIVIEIGFEIPIIVINLALFDLPIIKHVVNCSAANLSDLSPVPSRSLEVTLAVVHKFTMFILPLVSSSKMILGL